MLVDFVHVALEQDGLSRDRLHFFQVFEDHVDAVSGADVLLLPDPDGLQQGQTDLIDAVF